MRKMIFTAVAIVAFILGGNFIFADEGMWLLDNLPLAQLKGKYGFTPSTEWVEKVQKSSARLPNCSASFVSAKGLIMTNGHCGEDAVMALSMPTRNLYKNGFYSPTLAGELKTNLNIRVLMSMKDVTQMINDAVVNDNSGNPAKARQEIISQIQRNKVGLSTATMISNPIPGEQPFVCEVVTLYQGGQYHNYCYRVYDDIRLVFSSEKNTWFFGGDADNFEYPRFALDMAFFRAYENDKPAKTPFHFKWSKSGASERELIFVSGHPGRTERLFTSSALATERDVRAPFLLDLFRRRELTTQQAMLKGKEHRRIAESDLFRWQNFRKLYAGKVSGLQDESLMHNKELQEAELSATVNASNPELGKQLAEGRKLVTEAQEAQRNLYPIMLLYVRGLGFDTRLYDFGASIASGNPMHAQSVLDGRQDEAPLNLDYEEAKLRDSLTHLIEVLGSDDPRVRELKQQFGSGPDKIAYNLIRKTDLSDIKLHGAMVSIVVDAAKKSSDPMVVLARMVSENRKGYADEFMQALGKEREGYAKIADVMFKVYGTTQYPDATFTLRLSYGTIMDYAENDKRIPSMTTLGGLYRHSAKFDNAGDYKLPARWLKRKPFVNQETPLNFVSDLDITGGNSGSPVFNKNLEIVGLVFDGNRHSLVSDYDYNYSPRSRAVSVHSAGIVEVLRKIYLAEPLVRELTVR